MNERVRVTSPRTTSGRRLPPPSAAHEIDAQSQVGEVYLRSLLRAQLRLALVVVALLAVLVGGLPLAFWLLPEVMDQEVLGMPLAWGLLGFLVYPVLVGDRLVVRPGRRAQRAGLHRRRRAPVTDR